MGRRVGWRHSPEIQEQEGNAGFLELFLFACDGCRYLGPPCCYFLLTWVPVRLKEGEGGGESLGERLLGACMNVGRVVSGRIGKRCVVCFAHWLAMEFWGRVKRKSKALAALALPISSEIL